MPALILGGNYKYGICERKKSAGIKLTPADCLHFNTMSYGLDLDDSFDPLVNICDGGDALSDVESAAYPQDLDL